jgi:hypothetical protein
MTVEAKVFGMSDGRGQNLTQRRTGLRREQTSWMKKMEQHEGQNMA